MPAKKKQSRPAQPYPQPAPADYDIDTDTADPTDTIAAATIDLQPQRTNTELNLLILRRYIPAITHIVSIAPFAAVYLFSPETQLWEKCGIEGTLFVCQLSPSSPSTTNSPRFKVVILNRKSLENFVADLCSPDDVEVTEQYVILQVASEDTREGESRVYGLWIFDDEENAPGMRREVAERIQGCAAAAERGRMGEQGRDGRQVGGVLQEYREDMARKETRETEGNGVLRQESAGRSIDVNSLFTKPSGLSAPNPAEQGFAYNQPVSQHAAPRQMSSFGSTADNDFFRNSNNSAAPAQQRAQPPQQQNVLLDLFRSAKKG